VTKTLPIVELIRHEESFRWGTIGLLKIQKKVICFTLEPPDVLNKRNESSIPAQQYMVWRIVSPRYGDCFEVRDVPGRSGILFHAGNTLQDTSGCILLGNQVGKLKHNRAVLNSGQTYKQFMMLMSGHNAFHLTISEHY